MPDVDFVEEIKKTEQEADARIERARDEAAERREICRKKAEAKVDEAYREASYIRDEIAARARAQYDALIAEAETADESDLSFFSEEEKNRVAGLVAERVTGFLEHR